LNADTTTTLDGTTGPQQVTSPSITVSQGVTNPASDAKTTTNTSSDTPLTIPAAAAGQTTTTTSQINITGANDLTNAQQIRVTINIAIANTRDLAIFLIAPNGLSVQGSTPNIITLAQNVGTSGQPQSNFSGTVFTATATVSITSNTAVPPYTGNFLPQESFSDFFAKNNGIILETGLWKLEVVNGSGDVGQITNWSLQLSPDATGATATTAGQVTTVYDDFGQNQIDVSRMQTTAFGKAFVETPEGNAANVLDALPPPPTGGNSTPQATFFQITTGALPTSVTVGGVTIPFNLTGINIGLDLVDPDLDELAIFLFPPGANEPNVNTTAPIFPTTGPNGNKGIFLILNHVNDDGSTNTGIGITGTNLGIAQDTFSELGTFFDPTAARSIEDTGATAPFIGHYQPEGDLTPLLSDTFANLNISNGNLAKNPVGVWTLELVDNVSESGPGATPPVQFLPQWQINLTGNFSQIFANPNVEKNTVVGTAVGGVAPIPGTDASAFPLLTTASPNLGVGPNPVIAADNTLGSASLTKGNLYIAYVGKLNGVPTTSDNTDIFIVTSTNGGLTWSSPTVVNDDYTDNDGFSGALDLGGVITGRAQFSPALAVDQSTGTLVATWYDARYDAADARVARYVGVSIDAGQSFTQTYLNTAGTVVLPNGGGTKDGTAFNEITDEAVSLGPIPDNFSAGNANTDTTFGFGAGEGLAVADGLIVASWTGNLNGGPSGPNGTEKNQILTSTATFAGGPRAIIEPSSPTSNGSTMGPITPSTATDLNGNPVSFNTNTTTDGTPVFDGFVVYFDRPVAAGSFTKSAVTVYFRSANNTSMTGSVVGTVVPVLSVTPLFNETSPLTLAQQVLSGASKYLVSVQPQFGAGTYSYQIAPVLTDAIVNQASYQSTNVPQVLGSKTTSTTPVTSDSVLTVPDNFAVSSDTQIAVSVDLTYPRDSDLTLTLISPSGTRITLAAGVGGTTGQNYVNTVFSDGANTSINAANAPFDGRFIPQQPLSGLFSGGAISAQGTWTLEIVANATGNVGSLSSWSLEFLKSGNLMDENADGKGGITPTDFFAIPTPVNPGTYNAANNFFQAPYLSTTLPIVIPGPHIVNTFVPSSTSGSVVLNATNSAIDVVFDRNMNPATISGADVLRVIGPQGSVGPDGAIPASFSITPNPLGTDPDPNFPRTYQINILTPDGTAPLPLAVSGTYTLVLASTVQDQSGQTISTVTDEEGNALDTNENAGVDLLTEVTTGGFTPITFSSTNVPVGIGSLNTAGVVSDSTINVPSSFVLSTDEQISVSMNITYPRDPDLTVTLISPPVGIPPTPIRITLVSAAGSTGTQSNFTNTVFEDSASTGIDDGGPPFTGNFIPEEPLQDLFTNGGFDSKGTWTLEIGDSNSGKTGTLNSWSLQLGQPVLTTGLGESVGDQATATFRVFTMDPTNPLSSTTWTAVGPASANGNTNAGQVSAIAVDSSDPSGNTVFVGGMTGGVWKTTNFLTTNPAGPTYIPLTNFGPAFSLNIGSIAVFARNNDPRQSIVIAGTGDGEAGTGDNSNSTPAEQYGVGFLLSLDGGATWTLLDSSTNVDANGNTLPFNSPMRDHIFEGMTTNKIVIDPNPTPSGGVVIYAAMSGTNGGLYRSLDGGMHWALMRAGNATDVVLDPESGSVNSVGKPGNLQILFAAFAGDGIYESPNEGQVWNEMLGLGGNPQIQNPVGDVPIPVDQPVENPVGAALGRVTLAKPALVGNFLADKQYEGWLYALVTGSGPLFDGVYVTKNFGLSWTQIQIPNVDTAGLSIDPTNDITQGTEVSSDSTDMTISVDPTNPAIIYVGGQNGLQRLDTTGLYDAGAFYLGNDNEADAGALRIDTVGPVILSNWPTDELSPNVVTGNGYINLFRDPFDPLDAHSSFFINNVASLTNTGGGIDWTDFSIGVGGQYQTSVTEVDPLTGLPRLIVGTDEGIYSAVDNDGNVDSGIGSAPALSGSFNGNLDLFQMNYSASQPSIPVPGNAAGLFYGSAQDDGFTVSPAGILTPGSPDYGNLGWSGDPGTGLGLGSGGGVATDQTGSGDVYRYMDPGQGAGQYPTTPSVTDFFTIAQNGGADVSHTFGLIQTSSGGNGVPDAQWPIGIGYNFAVNPVDGNQIDLVSGSGRVFSSIDGGDIWSVIGDPQFLDGSVAPAITFGAPQPSDPTGALNDYVLIGTNAGHIFVTFTGGGSTGNQWINISAGLDGSGVREIVTDPTRGSYDAYAVTYDGVYFMANTQAANATWVNISGNLFTLEQSYFGPFAAAGTNFSSQKQVNPIADTGLNAVAADWRYAIPNNPAEVDNPASPPGPTHPVLYVAGTGGVFRSTDGGTTWTIYPDIADDDATIDGGYLPSVDVTDLDLVLGNIDPTTGRPLINDNGAMAPDVLLASTFGQGDFAISVPPTIVANSLQLDPTLPVPTGSQSGTESGFPKVSILQPVFDGMSEQSAFGNTVQVDMYDLTNPNNPILIGVSTVTPGQDFVDTDQTGRFKIQVEAGYFNANGTTDGIKTFGFQATDAAGAVGPMSTFTFDLDTTPIIQASSVQFAAGSDSGRSATDRITNVIQPTIIGQVIQAAPETVELIDVTNPNSPVVVGQGTTTTSGSFSIQVNPGVYLNNGTTDGVKTFEVEALHVPNPSNTVLFTWTLDTTPPATPAAPQLLASSDSGFSNSDHITDDTTPTFSGTGEPDAIVLLYNGSATPVGTDEVNTTGSYTVQVSNPLTDGSYNMTVQLVDVAGNSSKISAIMQPPLIIQTKAPSIPTIKLDPAYDTGTLGDNITAAIPAVFDGTTDPGTSVVIKDNGVQIDAFLEPIGSSTFAQSLSLADGVHTLVVQATNQAGNVSTSATLVITINSQALDADSKFIRAVYQLALGRPGTIAEWNYWSQFLVNGNGRATVANAIERSTEARTLTLDNWYKVYLQRSQAPSTAEIQFWLNEFNNGATEETVLSQLLASAEYYNLAPKVPGVTGGPKASDSTFVQELFIQLFNRTASSNDISFFSNLVSTVGRQQVVYTLLTSTEYRTDQVTIYYGPALLGRTVPPAASEVSGWVNSGLDLTSIRIDFLASTEFFFRVTGLNP
jgi:subtilisin-like proprotein convertase family protein